ncbi:type I phosphomannose isomerase catalytic subunit [Caldisalinibacter kiritimatiensis]|uniref:Phosphohexomutase n=1 Tax=Caldisalinibacter kiritimatiensis TaxID=1304284 RepID=R1AR73_9FIRM|nr:type I phosphomannose isomerase catalytic subunit [Caldisalinibacter kiritimatiensis]EOC99657.1 Mannose-6-phosphate isomerase [Caldisalinibacter kiritimatiensis]
MYPLKFENIYCEKVWGSRDLESFRDNLPEGKIGESWDVACHKNGTSVISNGEHKGMRLDDLIKEKGQELVGSKISTEWFPLLIKLLNTSGKLSVQVHPDDEYARKVEGDMGKTEVWYVVDAKEDAKLILGTNNCTKAEFEQAINNGNPEEYMNVVKVKKGDVYLIKSGLIHTMGEGLIIAEIQQNSDTTYRVYDYGRGRELHIEKALDVIDFELQGKKSEGLTVKKSGYSKTYYCLNEHFALELYDVHTSFAEKSDKERFYIFTCVEGEGKIKYRNGIEEIKMGDSLLIPATLGEYEVIGKMKLLKSYVPDVEKVEREILNVAK